MSIRGVKFIYCVGEPVLCFEPDPRKARVLYDAKILDTEVAHNKHGQRIPAYNVHFQGWNNSWDRVVPENFILANTDENRILMKQLSDATRKFRSNKSRNKYIDAVLRRTFKGKSPLTEDDEEETANVSDEEDEEDIEEESVNENEEKSIEDDGIANGIQNGGHHEDNQSTDGSENSGKSNRSEDRKKKLLSDFEIPEILKEELEKDYVSVIRDDMLVSLPAEQNVISILESFVKTFCVNILCGTPGKHRYLHKEGYHTPFEKNIPLCKELVDGIRICFDYTLPLVLLYDAERNQYNKLQSTYKYKADTKSSMQSPSRTPGRGRNSKHHTSSSSVNGEPSPKLPKLSPKIFKKEKLDFMDDEIAPRRMTRQSIHDCGKKDGSKVSGTESSSADDMDKEMDKKSDSGFSNHKRGRKGRRPSGNRDLTELKEEEIPVEKPGPSTRRGDRPPPLLLPSALSCNDKVHDSTGSNDSSDSITAANREDVINSVLSWQLLPPEACQTFAPSLVYGAQHLLRLFVKLPELIMSMDIKESKVKALVSLLEHFLDYLTERRTELFTSLSYKNADKL